jgi:hypothetical protein
MNIPVSTMTDRFITVLAFAVALVCVALSLVPQWVRWVRGGAGMKTGRKRIKAKDDAAASGQMFYFTGKPCLRGHIAKRFVSNRKCVECEHLANRLSYQRRKSRLIRSSNPLFALWPPRPDRVWRGPVGRTLARVRVNGVTLI